MTKALDANGVVDIIKAAHGQSILKIKWGDLEIEFNHTLSESPVSHKQEPSVQSQPEETLPTRPEVLFTTEDEEKIRAIEELQLMMDDPITFEDRVIAEQLEGAGHETTDHIGPESDLQ